MLLSFSVLDYFFSLKFVGFLGILGPPYCGTVVLWYCGSGAAIRIGPEILCLPYAGFFLDATVLTNVFLGTGYSLSY